MYLARHAFLVVLSSFLILAEARQNPTSHAHGGLIPALAESFGHGRNLVAGPLPSTRLASGSLNHSNFKEEITHDNLPGKPGRRRLLASLVDTSFTLSGGSVYTATIQGYTCINFKVTAAAYPGDDLTIVNVMKNSNYQTLYSNSFSGSYYYVEGSECTVTRSCEKTVSGLSSSETYKLVVYNNNDGYGSATVDVEIDDCASSTLVPPPPSPPPSTSGYDWSGLGDCPGVCSYNDNLYYGDCGAFSQKNDKHWCTASGSEFCCAPSDDDCCDTDGGAVAGLIIGLIVGLTGCITACAWCCKCCCFRPKPEGPVVVQMAAPLPVTAINVSPQMAAPLPATAINVSPAPAAPVTTSKPDGSTPAKPEVQLVEATLMQFFTRAERMNYKAATSSDPIIKDFAEMIALRPQPLKAADTIEAIDRLRELKVLSAGRATELKNMEA